MILVGWDKDKDIYDMIEQETDVLVRCLKMWLQHAPTTYRDFVIPWPGRNELQDISSGPALSE